MIMTETIDERYLFLMKSRQPLVTCANVNEYANSTMLYQINVWYILKVRCYSSSKGNNLYSS